VFGGIIAMAAVVRRDRGGNSVEERCRCHDLMSKLAMGCAALKQQPIAPNRRDADLDDLAETSIGDWKMPDFKAACSYAASQGWPIVQGDVLTLTTAGLAAA
jgi:hypothetical protein